MRPKPISATVLIETVVIALSTVGLTSCGAPKPDFSKNEGAVAWLAHHHGTIPRTCISEMVEKYGTSPQIDEAARRKAQADAMQIAGKTYAVSLASERLIIAREKVLEVEREGHAKGYVTESGVLDAITKVNEAIFAWELSRFDLAGLDACEFTATDEAFGFKRRSQVSYYSVGQ